MVIWHQKCAKSYCGLQAVNYWLLIHFLVLETIVWSARDLFPSETDTIAVTYLSLVAHAGYSLGGDFTCLRAWLSSAHDYSVAVWWVQ